MKQEMSVCDTGRGTDRNAPFLHTDAGGGSFYPLAGCRKERTFTLYSIGKRQQIPLTETGKKLWSEPRAHRAHLFSMVC